MKDIIPFGIVNKRHRVLKKIKKNNQINYLQTVDLFEKLNIRKQKLGKRNQKNSWIVK